MSAATIAGLRQHSVTEDKHQKIEYFFYTDTRQKATDFAAILNTHYTGATVSQQPQQKEFMISGWTNEISMTDSSIAYWINHMCELGYKYDCDFDGWGTNC